MLVVVVCERECVCLWTRENEKEQREPEREFLHKEKKNVYSMQTQQDKRERENDRISALTEEENMKMKRETQQACSG